MPVFSYLKERNLLQTAIFVDGYNLYYGLLAGTAYKWLDLKSLLTHILHVQDPSSSLNSVDFFTSGVKPNLATNGITSLHSQNTYIRALKNQGVSVHLGKHQVQRSKAPVYRKDQKPSRQDQVDIWKIEEKETDVRIAISMYQLAWKESLKEAGQGIEQIVLVSADTDLGPALKAIREDFPKMHIGVILPHREDISRDPPGSLRNQSHWMRRIAKDAELKNNQLPNRIHTRKWPLDKPTIW